MYVRMTIVWYRKYQHTHTHTIDNQTNKRKQNHSLPYRRYIITCDCISLWIVLILTHSHFSRIHVWTLSLPRHTIIIKCHHVVHSLSHPSLLFFSLKSFLVGTCCLLNSSCFQNRTKPPSFLISIDFIDFRDCCTVCPPSCFTALCVLRSEN